MSDTDRFTREEQGQEGGVFPDPLTNDADYLRQRYGHVYHPGHIMRIKVHNVMGLADLEINCHPYVNYFTGPNGTGKSTLMTSILVAFGDRREKKGMASIIRGIKKEAWIEVDVVVKRQPEGVVGPIVSTFRRVITRKTTKGPQTAASLKTQYHVLSSRGKMRQTSGVEDQLIGHDGSWTQEYDPATGTYRGCRWIPIKQEPLFRQFREQLRIQITNPFAIMEQDGAQQLATMKDPDRLSHLLDSADPQLKARLKDMQKEQERVNQMRAEVCSHKAEAEAQHKKLVMMQAIKERLASRDNNIEKMQRLSRATSWLNVISASKSEADAEAKAEAVRANRQEAHDLLADAKHEYQTIQGELREMRDRHVQSETMVDSTMGDVADTVRTIRDGAMTIVKDRRMIERMEADAEEAREARRRRREKRVQEQKAAKRDIITLEDKLSRAKRDLAEAGEQRKALGPGPDRAEISHLKNQLANANKQYSQERHRVERSGFNIPLFLRNHPDKGSRLEQQYSQLQRATSNNHLEGPIYGPLAAYMFRARAPDTQGRGRRDQGGLTQDLVDAAFYSVAWPSRGVIVDAYGPDQQKLSGQKWVRSSMSLHGLCSDLGRAPTQREANERAYQALPRPVEMADAEETFWSSVLVCGGILAFLGLIFFFSEMARNQVVQSYFSKVLVGTPIGSKVLVCEGLSNKSFIVGRVGHELAAMGRQDISLHTFDFDRKHFRTYGDVRATRDIECLESALHYEGLPEVGIFVGPLSSVYNTHSLLHSPSP
ncbi:hypothetical protein KIPB_001543 [Kipferlia bialata]|uniref:Structural maintenance of chromosomes protein 5 n=1 Tax=Kipferlia bialata TaxID=797122 RepID=A0A9K3CQQ1_9EUKA|nr:hypothetical protein KIPB_001543 [Kipferlia bialata]|eukprot:g1543.t1